MGGERAVEALERDRDQLWAEARVLYGDGPRRGGALWWPATHEERQLCNEEQEDRLLGDVWLGAIEPWLKINRSKPDAIVTVREVLTSCLQVSAERQDKAAATRVGSVLHQLGWEVISRKQRGETKERIYRRRPDEAEAEHERIEREGIQANGS